MILFKEDWAKYPTAMVHLSTKNRSWVRHAHLLKAMGVSNHAFHLALINPLLEHVDPHDPGLTREEIAMIALEIKINPWYFFREVARVPSLSGLDKPRLQANRGNIALWWCFFNHLFTFLIQIRQTGKSLSTDCLMVYLLFVMCVNTKINLLTKDDKLRRENVGRIKDIVASLPYYMQIQTTKDTDNGEEVTVKALNNFFKTHLPQSNKQRAENAARGMSTAIMAFDEPPFQVNFRISFEAALAAMGAAREQAKANDQPYGVIMTTTAGKKDTDSGSFVYGELQQAMQWHEGLLDCKNQEDLYDVIRSSSRDGKTIMMNITLNHRQLGKDDEWLRERMRNARAKGENAERDFLNRWTAGTTYSPFDNDTSERIRNSQKEAYYMEIDPKFKFSTYWYVKKDQIKHVQENCFLVIGLDSSEGGGGNNDYVGLIVIDSYSGNVLARCSMNSLSIHNFTEFIANFLEKFPRSVFMPEYKSTGVAIVDGLLQILPSRGIDPFARIFNWIVQDPITHRDKMMEIRRPMHIRDPDIYHTYKKYFGYVTAGSGLQSRDNLFGNPLIVGVGRFAERINDKELIDQMLALERRNGRIDHVQGKHDDLVVAWLLSFWFMLNAVNMEHYGMNPLYVLRDAPKVKEMSAAEVDAKRYQAHVRTEIDNLLEQIRKEEDETIIERHEIRLRHLENELVLEEGEIFSMEDLIRHARSTRRSRAAKTNTNQLSDSQYYERLARMLR